MPKSPFFHLQNMTRTGIMFSVKVGFVRRRRQCGERIGDLISSGLLILAGYLSNHFEHPQIQLRCKEIYLEIYKQKIDCFSQGREFRVVNLWENMRR